MGKGSAKRKAPDMRGPLQRLLDAERTAGEQSRLDVITPQMRERGDYTGRGSRIVHVSTLDRWFRDGDTGFGEGSRLAVEWCQKRWEARGYIGKLCANYSPTVGTGSCDADRDVELRDELDEVKGWFPHAYWTVFENVCRHGLPAGTAGSDLADNPAQAIAAAKATVGLVASFIAMRKGY